MTCIVGITDGDTVFIGSDSAGSDNGTLYLRKEGKVFRVGEMVIGVSGSMRMSQLLKYSLELPPIEGDVLTYVVAVFAAKVRDLLKANGQMEVTNARELMEGHIMVGVRGRLFTLDAALAVMEQPEEYAAIGCGMGEAKGVLWALHAYSINRKPQVALLEALAASERFNTDVRRPFHIVSTTCTTDIEAAL